MAKERKQNVKQIYFQYFFQTVNGFVTQLNRLHVDKWNCRIFWAIRFIATREKWDDKFKDCTQNPHMPLYSRSLWISPRIRVWNVLTFIWVSSKSDEKFTCNLYFGGYDSAAFKRRIFFFVSLIEIYFERLCEFYNRDCVNICLIEFLIESKRLWN